MRKMKDSGIEWIGEIPEDWEVGRIGELYTERKEKVSDKDFMPLSVTMKGILPQLASAAKSDAHDDRKLVKKGDFAINSRSDRRGSCGISDYDGSVSLINTILTPRNNMNPNYYNWLFHTTLFADEFYKWGHGIVDDLWTTNWSDMKNISIPVPPIESQILLSNYLDSKCEKIDSVISKTRETIEEYKKLKQSIITEVATGNVKIENGKVKESEMLELKGDNLPNNWRWMKLKYLVKYNIETLDEKTNENFNFDYVDISSVEFGKGITNFQNMNFKNAPSRARRILKKGDIILSTVRTYLRAIAKIEESKTPQIASTGFIVFTSEYDKIISDYLYYAISSENFISQVESHSVGISYPAINASQVVNFKILVPPLTSQLSLITFLDKKCSEIDKLITKKEQLVVELEAYKKSLIYEVVTGKRSV